MRKPFEPLQPFHFPNDDAQAAEVANEAIAEDLEFFQQYEAAALADLGKLKKALKNILYVDARPDLSLHKYHDALDLIHKYAHEALGHWLVEDEYGNKKWVEE